MSDTDQGLLAFAPKMWQFLGFLGAAFAGGAVVMGFIINASQVRIEATLEEAAVERADNLRRITLLETRNCILDAQDEGRDPIECATERR